MNQQRKQAINLILIGAGRRLVLALLIVMALWVLFFWATTTQAGL